MSDSSNHVSTYQSVIDRNRPFQNTKGEWCAGRSGQVIPEAAAKATLQDDRGNVITYLRKMARCNCPADHNHYFTIWVAQGDTRIFRCTRCYIEVT